MNFTREELKHLRDSLAEQYDDHFDIEPGATVTLRCEKGEPIIIGDLEYFGCGEIVSRHEVYEESRPMWEIVADLYILHLHNAHKFGDPYDELDDI